MGYQYIGPTSLYRLTFAEMTRLFAAYQRAADREADAVDAGQASAQGAGSAPTSGGRIRASDLRAAETFAQGRATTGGG